MLTLGTKSHYGLRALLHLAEHGAAGPLQLKDIAASRQIPQKYLEQIFNQLGRANIVRSFRGKNGGYKLAGDPAAITVKDVILLLEGGVELAPAGAGPGQSDALSALLQKAQDRLLETLAVSLADLLLQQRLRQEVVMFDI